MGDIQRTLRLHLAPAYGTKGLLVRIGADLVMANVGLFIGYLGTLFYYLLTRDDVSREWVVRTFRNDWLGGVAIYTSVCLGTFAASGLYSQAPGFRPLHKFWMAFRAVALAFLTHLALMYFARAALPRSAALFGWVIVLVLVAGARVGRNIFFIRYKVEPRKGPRDGKVNHVLVIGGAGYIGSTLVRRLLDAGYYVRVLDKLLFGDDSIRELRGRRGFEFIKGDFRNVECVVRALRGMDAAFHLGAIVGDPACALDDDVTTDINTNAVRMIREVSRGYGAGRFIFASTCSVYGAQDGVIDERSELAPVSLYARSKIEAEQAILELADEDFKPTILRLATVFGVSYRMRFDLVVNLLTARAVTEGRITIYDGQQWRPFIHVTDAARAFVTCLESPAALVGGKVYNAGDNRSNYTLAQLGEIIARVVPGTEVQSEERSAERRSYRVDFSKIAGELNFECLTTIEEGIEGVARAVRAGGLGSYKDRIYSNVATLAEEGADILATA